MQVIIIGQDRGQNYLDLVEFCSVRGIKLVEEKITSTNRPSVEIKPDCGNCLLASQCVYYGMPSDGCGYSARV